MVWSKENGYHQYGWWSKFTDSPICNVVTSPNMLLLVFLTNTNWVVNHTDCTRDHVVPDVLISVIRGGARSGSSTSMVTEWWGGLVVGVPLCLPHWVPMRSPTTPQHGPKISLTPGCAGEPQLTLWENTQIQMRIQNSNTQLMYNWSHLHLPNMVPNPAVHLVGLGETQLTLWANVFACCPSCYQRWQSLKKLSAINC